MIGSDYPLLDIFWTMLEFFLFFVWIFLIITIFIDIFRSRDMGGFAKAIWVIFIIVIPLFAALIYLIVRGGSMHERAEQQAKAQQEAFDSYVKQAAGTGSHADELAKLAALKDKGDISEAEFQTAKAKILG